MSYEDLLKKVRGIRSARVYVKEERKKTPPKKSTRAKKTAKPAIEKLFAGMTPEEKRKLMEILDES